VVVARLVPRDSCLIIDRPRDRPAGAIDSRHPVEQNKNMLADSPRPVSSIADLRRLLGMLEKMGADHGRPRLAFGVAAIDRRLDGGLLIPALHEATGKTTTVGDEAAATAFIAGLAARLGTAPVLWAGRQRDLHAPGIAQLGLHPDRLIRVEAIKDADVLAAMEEALRHGGLSAVVGEISHAGMTATRRLQLAAETRSVTALLLRRHHAATGAPFAEPSAAHGRWSLAALPSTPLPVDGVGRPRWRLTLVRQRGGEGDEWIVEGCDATGRIALAADAGDRADRTGIAGRRAA
jgi:protein ImuA